MRTAIILALAALSGCATTTFTDGSGRQVRCEASAGEKLDRYVLPYLGGAGNWKAREARERAVRQP